MDETIAGIDKKADPAPVKLLEKMGIRRLRCSSGAARPKYPFGVPCGDYY